MFNKIVFVILFTILFSWGLNLNTLSQILEDQKQRRLSLFLAALSGFLMSLLIVFFI